jgi:hypothetical protein
VSSEGRGSVAIRAFRGTRKASVYREHLIPHASFARIAAVGEREGLGVVSSLRRRAPQRLDKRRARRLAEEATAMRSTGELADLDDDLTAITEVARWCARAAGDAWMSFEGL